MSGEARVTINVIALAIAILMVIPSTSCSNGGTQDRIDLDPGSYVTADFLVDVNRTYEEAHVSIRTVPPGERLANPTTLSVYYETLGTHIFQFKGKGYGSFGHQTLFSDDSDSTSMVFRTPLDEKYISILLPEGAVIENARVDIAGFERVLNWSEPSFLVEEVNGSQLPISVYGDISVDFADIDDDGDLDMVKGDSSTVYKHKHIYLNVGTETVPVFKYSSSLSENLSMEIKSNPRFVDIDLDGDFDMFVGQYWGRVDFFRNNGTKQRPVWNLEPFLDEYFFGYEVCPSFADLDADGDQDLAIGQQNPGDLLSYFRNDWDGHRLNFTRVDIFRELELEKINYPAFSDYDLDGDQDLFMGHWETPLHLYQNIGNSTTPAWAPRVDFMDQYDLGHYLTPTFADLSGDGYDDLVVGAIEGTLPCFIRNVSFPTHVDIGFGPVVSGFDLGEEPKVTIKAVFTDQLAQMVALTEPTEGDDFVEMDLVSLLVTSDAIGEVFFSDLSIVYSLTVRSRDFSTALNQHLEDVRRSQGNEGKNRTQVLLYSSTQGSVLVSWHLEGGIPLSFREIDDTFEVQEDGIVLELVDLHRYVEYDGSLGDLFYTIHPVNGVVGNLYIHDGRFIAVDPTRHASFNNWTGTQRVRVTVEDQRGFTATSNVLTIVTVPVNDPPVIMDAFLPAALEDALYVHQLNVVDAEDDDLSFSLQKGPVTMGITDYGRIQWTPTRDEIGVHELTVTVADEEFQVSRVLQLRVNPVNDPPRFSDMPELVIYRSLAREFDWTAYVTDEDTPLYGLSISTVSSFVEVTGGTLTIFVPEDAEVGRDYLIELTVSDGLLSDTGQLRTIILAKNEHLSISTLPSVSVYRGRPFELDLRPYITYDRGPRSDLSVEVTSPLVTARGLVMKILIPGDQLKDRFSIAVEVSDGELTALGILDIVVQEDDVLLLLPIPVQLVLAGSEQTVDLGQYISDHALEVGYTLSSSSSRLVRSEGSAIVVLFNEPVELVILECSIKLNGSVEQLFDVPFRVEPTNHPPRMLHQFPDIEIQRWDAREIDLNEHFVDIDGDALTFHVSDDVFDVTEAGIIIVCHRKGLPDKVTCTITAGDGSLSVTSDAFTVTFLDEPDNVVGIGWGLWIIVGVVLLIVGIAVVILTRHRWRE